MPGYVLIEYIFFRMRLRQRFTLRNGRTKQQSSFVEVLNCLVRMSSI